MPGTSRASKNGTAITIAFMAIGALLVAYACVSLLKGFSVGVLGMLMLGSGMAVLGLVRWKVSSDAGRGTRTPRLP